MSARRTSSSTKRYHSGVVARRALLSAVAISVAASCGARSELQVPEAPPRSSAFCERAEYRAGYRQLSIYLLLDKSGSMNDDGKWAQATAALGAFVADPGVAGLGLGLQMFPRSILCDTGLYALPDVPIAPLPDNAPAVEAALAAADVDGQTPTRLVLRAGVEYARSVMLGDPSHAVALALVTDGAPNTCDSSASALAAVAADGAEGDPEVLTFTVGLSTGYLEPLAIIAAAGGTGQPTLIGADGGAQALVDTLRELRDRIERCRFAVPPVGEPALPSDIGASYTRGDGDPVPLDRVAGADACGGGDGFWADDPPTFVELCPATCAAVGDDPTARVQVVAGCGAGSQGSGAAPPGGECIDLVSFGCLPDCSSAGTIDPVCVGGVWKCPPGMISTNQCTECTAVPHGCCLPNDGLATASCIDGGWVCPPGGTIFGQALCKPPEACATLMPCAFGSYCAVADLSCGSGSTIGHCQPAPASCPAAVEIAACGCDGVVHQSACAAHAAGIDVSLHQSCPVPPGAFRCGGVFCAIAGQACRRAVDLSTGAPDVFDCVPKPPGCGSGCGCDLCAPCPPGKTCGEACDVDPSGGALLSCTSF
jgi:Mg-chelatase subunit ChlD